MPAYTASTHFLKEARRAMEEFDPYCAWLGTPAGSRPPDHYQLLGLAAFQDDRNLISAAANHQMAQVKPHFGGPQAALALRLLNEIASAKELLLNPEAKAAYDADLQRRQKAGPAFTPPPRKSRMKDVPLLPPGVEAQPEAPPVAAPPAAMAMPPAPVAPVAPPAYAPAAVAAIPQAPAYPQAAYAPQQPMMAMPMAQPAMAYGAPYQQPAPYGYPQPYGQPMMAREPEPIVSITRSRVPPPRRTSSTETALAMMALCVVAVAGVAGFIVWRMQNPDATTEGDGNEFAANSPFQRQPIIAEPARTNSGPTQRSAMEDLYPDNYKPNSNTAMKNNFSRPTSDDSMLGTPDPRTPMKKPDEMAKVEPPKMVEPPKKVEPPPAPPKTEPTKPEPPKTVPATPATPAMPEKVPDAKETAAVNKGLTTARTAIKLRHFADADTQFDLLELEGPTAKSLAEIDQVRSLCHYNKEFWHAAQESWKGLIAGNELMVNDETIVVVETSADKLIIRAAGQNRVYSVENMPASLALVLAEKWFKNDGVAKAALGAFHSTDPKGDKKKGRELLDQAAKEGVDVAGVLKEIDRK